MAGERTDERRDATHKVDPRKPDRSLGSTRRRGEERAEKLPGEVLTKHPTVTSKESAPAYQNTHNNNQNTTHRAKIAGMNVNYMNPECGGRDLFIYFLASTLSILCVIFPISKVLSNLQ